jgi:tetratricopeptide (TPR) repeat protein
MGETRQPLVRPWLWVVLGTLVMGGVGVGGYLLFGRLREGIEYVKHEPERVAAARDERQRPAVHVAPGPLPTALPLLGPDGTDADGYPRKYVDRVALRSLLHCHKFADLTAYFEQLQTAFEADPRKEYWPVDAGEAFGSAEPEIVADLDAWVAATPQSFAPYFARGNHYVSALWAKRGEKSVYATPEQDLEAMHAGGVPAFADLDRAIALRPKLVAAMRQEILGAEPLGDHERIANNRKLAISTCPSCFQVRAAVAAFLIPRWSGSRRGARRNLGADAGADGGSGAHAGARGHADGGAGLGLGADPDAYAQLHAFAAEAPRDLNPRFAALAGFENQDLGDLAWSAGRLDEALADYDHAIARGPYSPFFLSRARLLVALKRYDEAEVMVDQALAYRPMHPDAVRERASIHYYRKEYLPAGLDMLASLRMDPTDSEMKTWIPYVLSGVIFRARQLEQAGDHANALDAADLAMDLCPDDRTQQNTHAQIVLGDATTPDKVAALEARVAASPGDFRAVQQLDYAWDNQHRPMEGNLKIWNAYLAIHPDDGRAYMERGGTYQRLRKIAESKADLTRACDLGVNEGCELLGMI